MESDELDITAYIKTESERQQFDTLMRVFEIFRDRSEVRGDLWAEFNENDALHNMRSKLARIEGAWKSLSTDPLPWTAEQLTRFQDSLIDDALDLCNYAVFLIRHIEGAKP